MPKPRTLSKLHPALGIEAVARRRGASWFYGGWRRPQEAPAPPLKALCGTRRLQADSPLERPNN